MLGPLGPRQAPQRDSSASSSRGHPFTWVVFSEPVRQPSQPQWQEVVAAAGSPRRSYVHRPACVCMHRARDHMCTRTRNFDLPLTRPLSFLLTLLMVFVFLVCHSKINMESGLCRACL